MQVRTFRARNIQQALIQVRKELGPDASILHTRDIGGGLLNILGRKRIEVTASNTVQVPSRLAGLVHNSGATDESYWSHEAGPFDPSQLNGSHPIASEMNGDPQTNDGVASTPLTIPGSDIPPALFEAFTDLLELEFDPGLAHQIISTLQCTSHRDDLNDPWFIKGRLLQWIRSQIRVSEAIQCVPSKPQTIALVGPTGVGKTTTLAKLAAEFTLEDHAEVGFVTIDTFRIGAVEQLRKYAEIMELPIEVVESASQMRPALNRMSHCSLVFIDTAGRSPRDDNQLQILKEMLDATKPDQIHLVLSSTTSPASFREAVHRFRAVSPSHLLLTKLDEAHGLGGLFREIQQSSLPISYVTTGQNVPNDIQHASGTRLASLMLGHVDVSAL